MFSTNRSKKPLKSEMTLTRNRVALIAASVAAATALVMGCGGGGDSSTQATATKSAAPEQRALATHANASTLVTPMLPSDPK